MDDRRVRAHIYRCFVDDGEPPTVPSTAAHFGVEGREVEASFRRLAGQHEIVLAPGSHQIRMAHPFSAVPTNYLVESLDGRRWWANCAWDAVAIPGLVGDSIVHARSPVDGSAWEAWVTDGVVDPPHLIHFEVPASRFWDDIGFT